MQSLGTAGTAIGGRGIAITPDGRGGNGIWQQGSNGRAIDNIVTGGSGGIGGNGILQQASNGTIINNVVDSGGNGIQVTATANTNIIQNCIATNCGSNGFSMLTSYTVNVLECVANFNAVNGFDLSNSTGKGLIKACVASQNVGCGFRDRSTSTYAYMANSAEGNGFNPAASMLLSTTDTNYGWSDFSSTSTFTSPSGPGAAPFYQFTPNNTGAVTPNLSLYSNITAQ